VSPVPDLRRSARRFLFVDDAAEYRPESDGVMTETKFLTPQGFEKLKQELEYLYTVKRPQIAEHIRIAKEDGDLTENAGYDAAKADQSFVEGRIQTLESILKYAEIITDQKVSDRVIVGSRVTVREDGSDSEVFHIVGSPEANPAEGRISNVSPLGRALLGRRIGDRVEVVTPAGVVTFVILGIG